MFIYIFFLLLFRLERYTGAYTHHRDNRRVQKLFAIWDRFMHNQFSQRKMEEEKNKTRTHTHTRILWIIIAMQTHFM